MNSPIKTNQLRLTAQYDVINEKYDFFEITTSERYFKNGARILDAPLMDQRVCAVRFSHGKTFYVMMAHVSGNLNALHSVLKTAPDGDKITISQKKCQELYNDVFVQLLLNSLASAQSKFLRFNNLTGQLFCFHPQWLKYSKKNGEDIVMKVPCLHIQVTQQLRLQASVCTFTSVLLRKKITFKKRRFEEYPQYVLSAHHTLRRKLESDTATAFIQRQTDDNRTDIPFLDFQDLTRFEQSKMGVVWQVLSDFNSKYNGVAHLSFDEATSYEALDYDRYTAKEDKQSVQNALSETSVKLIDTIGNDYSKVFCQSIADLFLSKYGVSVSIGKRVSKGHLNVRIIHNKAYYEGSKDPHDDIFPDAAVQHITLEDFSDSSESAISTIVHELLIKQDLNKGCISLFNWKALGYQHDWSFGISTDEEPKRYFFMTIHPDGTFTINEQTLNLFEQSEYNDYITIFDSAKRSDEQVRGVIRNDDGKINIIRDTGWFTIPQIEQIHAELKTGNTYLRSKTVRDELLSACLDVKYISEKDCGYYWVGTIGNGMRANIARASNIRKIEPYQDAPIFFDELLPLMNVSFVRNGQLTILPFPFKYLREFINRL